MIYIFVIIYFLAGLGVALALDDNRSRGWIAIAEFLVALLTWPMMLTFAITLMAKSVAPHGFRSSTKDVKP